MEFKVQIYVRCVMRMFLSMGVVCRPDYCPRITAQYFSLEFTAKPRRGGSKETIQFVIRVVLNSSYSNLSAISRFNFSFLTKII